MNDENFVAPKGDIGHFESPKQLYDSYLELFDEAERLRTERENFKYDNEILRGGKRNTPLSHKVTNMLMEKDASELTNADFQDLLRFIDQLYGTIEEAEMNTFTLQKKLADERGHRITCLNTAKGLVEDLFAGLAKP